MIYILYMIHMLRLLIPTHPAFKRLFHQEVAFQTALGRIQGGPGQHEAAQVAWARRGSGEILGKDVPQNVEKMWENVGNMWENVGKCRKMWENVDKMLENVGNMWENDGKCGQHVDKM